MTEETEAKITEELVKKSESGRISCRAALALAERLGVAPSFVGKAANRERVKIVACQLGCFK